MSQLYSDYNENQTQILLIAELGLVIINLICFYMTVAMSKSNRQATLLKLEKQQQEYRIKYAETIKNQYEETARLRQLKEEGKMNSDRYMQRRKEIQAALNTAQEMLDCYVPLLVAINTDYLEPI